MNKQEKNTLGKNIKRFRKSFGITQPELAEKIDVDAKYISRIETGSSKPSLNTIEKIAEVMQVEPAQLFETRQELSKDEIIDKLTKKIKRTSLKNAQIIYEISEKILSSY